jgi:hypothetical protein
MFNGFKMSSFRCKSHVKEIIFAKKHFWLSIETQFHILNIFLPFLLLTKILIHIMYACEKSSSSYELF